LDLYLWSALEASRGWKIHKNARRNLKKKVKFSTTSILIIIEIVLIRIFGLLLNLKSFIKVDVRITIIKLRLKSQMRYKRK